MVLFTCHGIRLQLTRPGRNRPQTCLPVTQPLRLNWSTTDLILRQVYARFVGNETLLMIPTGAGYIRVSLRIMLG